MQVFGITDDIKQNLYKLNLPYFKDPNKQEIIETKKEEESEKTEKTEKKKVEQVISNTMIRLKGIS